MDTKLSKKEKRAKKKLLKMEAHFNLISGEDESSSGPSAKKFKSSDEDVTSMKRAIKVHNQTIHAPKLKLKPLGEKAHLDYDPNLRTPIFVTDISNLLLRVLFRKEAPEDEWPWYKIEHICNISTAVVLVVEGLSVFHYQTYPQYLEKSLYKFDIKLETVFPVNRGNGEIIEQLLSCPHTAINRKDWLEKYPSLEIAILNNRNPTYLSKSIFPIETNGTAEDQQQLPETDKFSRTKLLLSPVQMIGEQYPFPLQGLLHHRYKSYTMTKDRYTEVTASSPMFGVDCEMVRTCKGILELARISIVNEKHESVYESLVRPKSVIVDYLTSHSGMTKELLIDVTKTLEDVQRDIKELLPSDAILVGHSLENDLVVLRMMHPYVIDTSIIYNLTGAQKFKSKLKMLVGKFLGATIQSDKWHDSIEDAVSSLKLVQLKLSKSLEFGDDVMSSKIRSQSVYQHLKNDPPLELKNDKINNLRSGLKGISILYARHTTNLKMDFYAPEDDELLPDYFNVYSATDNQSAVKKTWQILEENQMQQFIMTHIKVDELDEANVEEEMRKIDSYIMDIWVKLPGNSLISVVMAGSPGTSTGAFLMNIKK